MIEFRKAKDFESRITKFTFIAGDGRGGPSGGRGRGRGAAGGYGGGSETGGGGSPSRSKAISRNPFDTQVSNILGSSFGPSPATTGTNTGTHPVAEPYVGLRNKSIAPAGTITSTYATPDGVLFAGGVQSIIGSQNFSGTVPGRNPFDTEKDEFVGKAFDTTTNTPGGDGTTPPVTPVTPTTPPNTGGDNPVTETVGDPLIPADATTASNIEKNQRERRSLYGRSAQGLGTGTSFFSQRAF